jgi:hypothetical protein
MAARSVPKVTGMIDKAQQDLIYLEVLKELSRSSIEEAHSRRPRYLASAERESRRLGVSVEEVLGQQLAKLRASNYPGPDCLDPESIDKLILNGPTSAQRQHLDSCPLCATLVTLAQENHDPPIPVSEQFGFGLKEKVLALEGRKGRRKELRWVLDGFCAANPEPRLAERLIRLADTERWPAWAVECLPSLCVRMPSPPGDSAKVLIWHYLSECVPGRDQVVVHATLCSGLILDALIGAANEQWVQAFAPVFERSRLGNPFPSVESMVGVVLDTIRELERSSSHPEVRDALQDARNRVFRSLFRSVVEMRPETRTELTIQAQQLTDRPWVKTALKGVA